MATLATENMNLKITKPTWLPLAFNRVVKVLDAGDGLESAFESSIECHY